MATTVVGGTEQADAHTVVTGRYPSGGEFAEQDTAALAALAAHIADTTNVHGITDGLELDLRTEIGGVSPLQWYRNGKA